MVYYLIKYRPFGCIFGNMSKNYSVLSDLVIISEENMKQMKGKGIAKASRRFTDEDRCGKKRLRKSIKISEIKCEFDEDKLNSQQSTYKDKGEKL